MRLTPALRYLNVAALRGRLGRDAESDGALMLPIKLLTILFALGALACQAARADHVRVSHAWVRATVPGQSVAGAFMDITAATTARLVAVRSPAASVEIHVMQMDGNIMRMREVDAIGLPKNSTVRLAPGGYHLMLTPLKKSIDPGDVIPLTLIVESAGRRESIAVEAIARSPL